VQQSFSFVAPPGARTNEPAASRVLNFRRVVVAAPYDSQLFTYRTGEYSFERDPYAKFLAPPEESLSQALQTDFQKTGLFKAVTEPGSLLRADTVGEARVDELDGDFRNRAAPEAVLSIRFAFFQTGGGQPPKAILEKEYTRRVSLRARTAAAVMAGWNKALEQIVTAAATDLERQTTACADPGLNTRLEGGSG
jgi:cholesterol transport system auxiliary component